MKQQGRGRRRASLRMATLSARAAKKEDLHPLNHSGSWNRDPKVDARLVEVIHFGEYVAEWLDEEASWRGTTQQEISYTF